MKRLLLLITICISSVSFGQLPSYVPTNGLVGWWGFNGNANDESGNGNDGTVNGATPTTDRFGNSNSAYDFNGSGEHILVPHSPTFINPNLTFSCWVNPTQLTTYFNSIIKHGNYTTNAGEQYGIGLDLSGAIHTGFKTNNCNAGQGWDVSLTNQTVSINTWNHIVVVIENNLIKTNLNGQLIFSYPYVGSLVICNANSEISFGREFNGSANHFYGKIDDIGIWSRALTECEIQDLYDGSLGNCCTQNPITTQPTDVTVPLNGTGMFYTTTSVTSPTYQWQMDNGTGYMDLTNAGQFSGVDTDMLTVSNVTLGQNNTLFRCIVTENSNCSDTTDVAVLTVEDNTGIEELNQQISIYPNPTSTSFTITSKNSINSSFKLMDIQGKVVLTGKIESTEETVDISKLSKGQYNLVFEDESISPISIIKN